MSPHCAASESARWRWHAARNVLAVRLDNLGDLLMTTPALAAVRCSLPKARLTLLTSTSGAALAPHLPVVDDVIAFEAPVGKGRGVFFGPEILKRAQPHGTFKLLFNSIVMSGGVSGSR